VLKTLPPKSLKKRGFNSLEENGGADRERNGEKRWILDLIRFLKKKFLSLTTHLICLFQFLSGLTSS